MSDIKRQLICKDANKTTQIECTDYKGTKYCKEVTSVVKICVPEVEGNTFDAYTRLQIVLNGLYHQLPKEESEPLTQK